MKLSEKFWEYVATKLYEEVGYAHPRDWQQDDIDSFLSKLEQKVKEACRSDINLSIRCKVPYIKGRYEVDQWTAIDSSTFRRMFHHGKTQHCKKKTKNQFAVYLGYSSFEDLIKREGIAADKDSEVLMVPGDKLAPENPKKRESAYNLLNSTYFTWAAIVLLFFISVTVFNFYQNKQVKAELAKQEQLYIEATKKRIRGLLQNFEFDGNVSVNDIEARRLLKELGITRETQRKDGEYYAGMLNDSCEVTIWVGTYNHTDRYGLRFTAPDGSHYGENKTYMEIMRPYNMKEVQ